VSVQLCFLGTSPGTLTLDLVRYSLVGDHFFSTYQFIQACVDVKISAI